MFWITYLNSNTFNFEISVRFEKMQKYAEIVKLFKNPKNMLNLFKYLVLSAQKKPPLVPAGKTNQD